MKRILNDNDAVSPVIGVILMVAITVILAAVIATFVLGLGESTSDTAPQASFSFDFDGDEVTATHSSGAVFNADNTGSLELRVSGEAIVTIDDPSVTQIGAGDRLQGEYTESIEGGEDVRVVWSSPDGDNSATIAQTSAPN